MTDRGCCSDMEARGNATTCNTHVAQERHTAAVSDVRKVHSWGGCTIPSVCICNIATFGGGVHTVSEHRAAAVFHTEAREENWKGQGKMEEGGLFFRRQYSN